MNPFKRIQIIVVLFLMSFVTSSFANEGYQRLKDETGATDEELSRAIKFHLEIAKMTKDFGGVEAPNWKELQEMKAITLKSIRSIQAEQEMVAVRTLLYLKILEEEGAEAAARIMAKQLMRSFVNPEDFASESGKSNYKIYLDYSKSSPAIQKQISEQNVPPKSDRAGE